MQITSSLLSRLTKELNLTPAGQIKMQMFPEAALEYALIRLDSTPHTTNPWGLFNKIAIDYCQNRNIDLHWPEFYRNLEKEGLSKDSPMTVSTNLQRIETPQKKTTHAPYRPYNQSIESREQLIWSVYGVKAQEYDAMRFIEHANALVLYEERQNNDPIRRAT